MAKSHVTFTRYITNQDITMRGLRVLGVAANKVMREFIRPKTPMLTGDLRRSLGVTVRTGSDITISWYATAMPQARLLEENQSVIDRIKNFTTPGTRAPYLRPGVEEGWDAVMIPAIEEWIDP